MQFMCACVGVGGREEMHFVMWILSERYFKMLVKTKHVWLSPSLYHVLV